MSATSAGLTPSPRVIPFAYGTTTSIQPAAGSTNTHLAIVEARRLQQDNRSPSTIFTYENGWKSFVRWVAKNHPDRDALPASPGLIGIYIGSERVRKIHKASILVRLHAIKYAHEDLAGVPSPFDDPELRKVMRGLQRQPDAVRRVGRALVAEQVTAILTKLGSPQTLMEMRDQTILAFGWNTAMRRSEIVAVDVEHLTFGHDSLTGLEFFQVFVPRSKTDQMGAGDVINIPAMPTDSPLCAVRAVRRWLKESRLDTGPLFPAVARGGWTIRGSGTKRVRISGQAIYKIVKAILTAAGFDARLWAPHSLRRGFATSADAAGVRPSLIQRHGRWKSFEMVSRYTIHEGIRENALREMFATEKEPGAGSR